MREEIVSLAQHKCIAFIQVQVTKEEKRNKKLNEERYRKEEKKSYNMMLKSNHNFLDKFCYGDQGANFLPFQIHQYKL